MDEIRTGDVLRLFFGKEHKHYLVVKVGRHSLKLKNEQGDIVPLHHKDGVIDKIGDATLTGFEVLRDPHRHASYKVGSDVRVRTPDGAMVQGEIVENDDGLLKIKQATGQETYFDLDTANAELLTTETDTDPVKLPDLDDLLFLKMNKGNHLRELLRTPSSPWPTPCWIFPVLNKTKWTLPLVRTRRENETWGNTVFKPVRTECGNLPEVRHARTENVLFDVTVYPDKAVPVYTLVDNLRPTSYAYVAPSQYVQDSFLYPNSGVNLTTILTTVEQFDTLEEAVAEHVPDLTHTTSLFDLATALYPLEVNDTLAKRLPVAMLATKRPHAPIENAPVKASRYSLAAAYAGRIPEQLTTSETLQRMFALDHGEAYFTKTARFPKLMDKQWALERFTQKMKHHPSKQQPFAKEVVGLWNRAFHLFTTNQFSEFVDVANHYGRVASSKEELHWLYFSVPMFSKLKFVPASFYHYAQVRCYRGKTASFPHLIEVEGSMIDPTTGFVFSRSKPSPKTNSMADFESMVRDPVHFNETDLIVLDLARRLARTLNVALKDEHRLLNHVRLERDDAYHTACAVAAYVAHFGNLSVGAVAEALRTVSRRSYWTSVRESKELSKDVAARMNGFEVTPKPKPWSERKHRMQENVPYLPFDHNAPENVPEVPVAMAALTVAPSVRTPEYMNLADVFAPDLNPIHVVVRCSPTVMAVLAPSEKALMAYLGKEPLDKLYEFVLNVACVVPTLLCNGKRGLTQPVTNPMLEKWTAYYAPLLAMELPKETNDVGSRFKHFYGTKAAQFRRLAFVARTALQKGDEIMMEACAVRALYFFLVDDMSDEMEAYLKQFIHACVHMYRFSLV